MKIVSCRSEILVLFICIIVAVAIGPLKFYYQSEKVAEKKHSSEPQAEWIEPQTLNQLSAEVVHGKSGSGQTENEQISQIADVEEVEPETVQPEPNFPNQEVLITETPEPVSPESIELTEQPIELIDEELQQEIEEEINEFESRYEATLREFEVTFENKGQIFDKIISLIDDSDPQRKVWLIEMLIERFDSDSNPDNRIACLIGTIPFKSESRQLCAKALSSDTDRGVRRMAAYILQQCGTEEEIDVLLQAVEDDKDVVGEGRKIAEQSIIALGQIGGQRAAKSLLGIWYSEELSLDCREVIIDALGMTGDLFAFGVLETVLGGYDQSLRDNAVFGLAQLAMQNMDNKLLIDQTLLLLRQYIYDGDYSVRMNVIDALGYIGGQEDIELLAPLLDDGYVSLVSYTDDGEVEDTVDYDVRGQVQQAIDRINSRSASDN